MLKITGSLMLALLLVGASAARADLVVWKLAGLSFEDGAGAQGQFTVDTQIKLVTDFVISTEAGATLTSAFTYNSATAHISGQAIEAESGEGFFLELVATDVPIPTAARVLHLSFSEALVPTGPVSIVSDAMLGRVSYERQSSGQTDALRVVKETGTLSAVPEPAVLLYVALGLPALGLGAVRRRARTRAGSEQAV